MSFKTHQKGVCLFGEGLFNSRLPKKSKMVLLKSKNSFTFAVLSQKNQRVW